jgi:hypothetical protein
MAAGREPLKKLSRSLQFICSHRTIWPVEIKALMRTIPKTHNERHEEGGEMMIFIEQNQMSLEKAIARLNGPSAENLL